MFCKTYLKKSSFVLAIAISFLSQTNLTQAAQSWIQLSPTGGPPTGRYYHTAVYDTNNHRMTIFGGMFYTGSSSIYLNDVWVLSNANGLGGTPTWTHLLPTGSAPTTRYGHAAVYDAGNNLMTIFGGVNGATYLNDVWVLSNANGLDSTTSAWTQLAPTGSAPTTRFGPTAVYDTTHNRMTIYGGNNSSGLLNDVWVLSNANGLDSTTSAWTQLFPTGSAPTLRQGQTAVYDATHNQMIIFGGVNGGTYLNDVWVLSNANGLGITTSAWTQLFPTGITPTPRFGHTAFYDAASNRMTIFGGDFWNINYYLNDVWVLDAANGTFVPKEIWEWFDK